MKNFILVLSMLITATAWSQELPFIFKGRVENIDNGGYEGAVTVAIVQNGENKFSVQSSSNGKYTLRGNIDYSSAFDVVFSKGGLVSKRVHFDLSDMNEEDIPPGEVRPVEELNMTLFKERDNVDFSFLDSEPVASFDWSTRTMSSKLDGPAMNKMKAKIEGLLLAEEKKKAENEAAYNEAIFQADAAFDEENYEKSLGKYKEALGYKPNEEKPKNRIIELEALIKAENEANAVADAEKAAYDKLITDADKLRDAGNLEAALPKYKEAATKTEEVYPDDQVKLLTKQIADKKKEAASQAAYDAAMSSGESLLGQNKLEAAKAKFTEASTLKPSEAEPKAKLKEIEEKMKAEADKAANKQKFDATISAANALFDKKEWQAAKDKYSEALTLDNTSAHAKTRKQACDENLAKDQAEAAKEKQIKDLLDAGNASMGTKSYEKAITSFEEVLKLDSGNSEATQKLATAKQKLEEINLQASKDKEFNELVSQGDQKLSAKSYQESIDKYEAAIAIKPSTEVSKKISDAKAKLKEETELAEKSAEFDRLIDEGNQLMSSDKLNEAKAKFTQAGKLNPSSDVPNKKIEEINTLLADQKADAENKAKYDELISSANNLYDTEKWTAAEAKYREAVKLTDDKAYAQGRILEIKAKLFEVQAEEERKTKYEGLISSANQAFNSKDWSDADSKYKEALDFTDDKAYAQGRIDEIKTKLAAEKAIADKAAKYDELVNAANKLYDGNKWAEAEAKYKEALKYTDDRAYVDGRIDEIQKKIAGDQAESAKKEKYEELVQQANSLYDGGNWDDAQSKYKEALNYTDDKSYAQGRIDDIKVKLGDEKAEADKQAKVTALLQQGKNLYNSKSYEAARTKYEEVISLDNGNSEAKSQIDKINTELASMKDDAQKEADFKKLRDEGYALLGNKDYSGAKSKLQEALTLKDDAGVKAKITEIENIQKDQQASAKKDEDYDNTISQAESLASSGKYSDAIAKYKEALAIKPTEPGPLAKIAELEGKLKDNEDQAIKDKEYDELMSKGESLMAQEKYLEAIKEFNAALKIKPTESAPVDRAAEAERLAMESVSDLDRAIQKNLRIAEEKMNAGNYERASKILDDTEKTKPDEPRIKELRNQIKILQKLDKDYDDLMKSGNNLAGAKKYQDAKTKFEEASRKKPELQLPKDKIKEMRDLIDKEASTAQKNQLYNDYMTKGGKRQGDKEYELALSSYQDALSVKPGDAAATSKINEIQQIMDNAANASASAIKNQNDFDALIKQADILFTDKTYLDAKGVYEQALGIFSDNKYAKLQVEECIRLSRNESSAEEQRQYQKLIAAGDKEFGKENYEKAIMRYQTAVSLRSYDPYPKEKLAEIDAILNPKTEESPELVDLGTPFSGSILDGASALEEAEAQRKQLNKQAVQSKFDKIESDNVTMTDRKRQEHYDNTNEIYQVQMEIELDNGESDMGRQETVAALRIAEEELLNERIRNNQYENSENIGDQDVLYVINKEVELEYGDRDQEHLDNADLLDSYSVDIENSARAQVQAEQTENYTSDRQLKAAMATVQSEMIDDFEDRERVRKDVYDTKQAVEIDFTAASIDNYERLIKTQGAVDKSEDEFTTKQREDTQMALANNEGVKEIDNNIAEANEALIGVEYEDHYDANKTLDGIKEGYETKTAEDVETVKENNNDLTEIKLDILASEREQQANETALVYQADREMAVIKAEMIDEQEGMSDNRRENAEVLKKETQEYAEDHYDNYSAHMERSRTNRDVIEKEKDLNSDVDDLAAEAHAKKVSYVESMAEKSQADVQGIAMSDEAERLNSQKAVGDIYTDIDATVAEEKDAHVESSQALEATKRVINKKNSNEAIGETEKHYDAADKIHGMDNEPDKKVKVANSLGEEYPEGVSQESFTQNDQNGLMTAVITRRIVVVEGHADVYVRTQTLHGLTFSKNGKPSLQHVWNSETQGPHLERHY